MVDSPHLDKRAARSIVVDVTHGATWSIITNPSAAGIGTLPTHMSFSRWPPQQSVKDGRQLA